MSEHNDNCAKCFGRGFVWRYNKKSQTAMPCQRCRASGIEPAKKSRRKTK